MSSRFERRMRKDANRRRRAREDAKPPRPGKAEVKRVIDEVDTLDLPDGAHWAMVHDRLGLEYGDVFDYIADDPAFFDATEE